jgi:hypothetical protein
MQLHKRLMNSMFGKAALVAAALGGFLFFTGAPAAQAQVYGYREPRPVVRYDNYRLHRAIVRDGFYSPQANYWRSNRREAYVHPWCDRFGVWHRY